MHIFNNFSQTNIIYFLIWKKNPIELNFFSNFHILNFFILVFFFIFLRNRYILLKGFLLILACGFFPVVCGRWGEIRVLSECVSGVFQAGEAVGLRAGTQTAAVKLKTSSSSVLPVPAWTSQTVHRLVGRSSWWARCHGYLGTSVSICFMRRTCVFLSCSTCTWLELTHWTRAARHHSDFFSLLSILNVKPTLNRFTFRRQHARVRVWFRGLEQFNRS